MVGDEAKSRWSHLSVSLSLPKPASSSSSNLHNYLLHIHHHSKQPIYTSKIPRNIHSQPPAVQNPRTPSPTQLKEKVFPYHQQTIGSHHRIRNSRLHTLVSSPPSQLKQHSSTPLIRPRQKLHVNRSSNQRPKIASNTRWSAST